ncbi:hypothetical protein [Burkholderia sp. WP9]|uniref:hypothetical protein n=1 Tax=Burkholderia sp. WP9 TaxID=1500263 RepID=UPI00115FCDA9|nr:hypothetical protein [Burkholderia sp. WP9]
MFRDVFFSLDSRAGMSLPTGSILVVPSPDNWNDFGYQTFCDFLVVGESTERKFHLAFLDPSHKVRDVINAVVNIPSEAVAAHALPDFFSLQTEMEQYRELVSKFGPEEAQWILRSLHDLRRLSTYLSRHFMRTALVLPAACAPD